MPKLKQSEISLVEAACDTGQGPGYVLDFTDRKFAAYFDEEFGVAINNDRYRIEGDSKGKRLRVFLAAEEGSSAARVLRALWCAILERRGIEETPV